MVCSLALAWGAWAQDVAKAKAEIQSARDRYCALLKSRDAKALKTFIEAHYVKPFKVEDKKGGIQSRGQIIVSQTEAMARFRKVHEAKVKLLEVKANGGRVSVTELFTLRVDWQPAKPNARPVEFRYEEKARTSYVWMGGRWMAERSQILEEKRLIDGKAPTPPKASAPVKKK